MVPNESYAPFPPCRRSKAQRRHDAPFLHKKRRPPIFRSAVLFHFSYFPYSLKHQPASGFSFQQYSMPSAMEKALSLPKWSATKPRAISIPADTPAAV